MVWLVFQFYLFHQAKNRTLLMKQHLKFCFKILTMRSYFSFPKQFWAFQWASPWNYSSSNLKDVRKYIPGIFMILVPRSQPQKASSKAFSRWKSRSLESWSLLWRVLEVFYGSENIQIKPKLWIEHQKNQKLFLDVLLTKILIHNRFRVCLSLEMILNS